VDCTSAWRGVQGTTATLPRGPPGNGGRTHFRHDLEWTKPKYIALKAASHHSNTISHFVQPCTSTYELSLQPFVALRSFVSHHPCQRPTDAIHGWFYRHVLHFQIRISEYFSQVHLSFYIYEVCVLFSKPRSTGLDGFHKYINSRTFPDNIRRPYLDSQWPADRTNLTNRPCLFPDRQTAVQTT
jgi:hypothetical protein